MSIVTVDTINCAKLPISTNTIQSTSGKKSISVNPIITDGSTATNLLHEVNKVEIDINMGIQTDSNILKHNSVMNANGTIFGISIPDLKVGQNADAGTVIMYNNLIPQVLEPSIIGTNTKFGDQICISKSGVYIAATYNTLINNNYNNPILTVYKQVNNIFVEYQTIIIDDISMDYISSIDISADGKYLIVGCAANINKVFIYVRGNSSFSLHSVIEPSILSSISFGYSVKINAIGDTIIIGDPGYRYPTPADIYTGIVYIYRKVNDSWQQVQQIVASDAHSGNNYGSLVNISDNGHIILVRGVDVINTRKGAVYIYSLGADSLYTDEFKLTAHDASDNSYFGSYISVTTDATRLSIYALDCLNDGFSFPGYIYIYDKAATSTSYILKQKIKASDIQSNLYFGISHQLSATGDKLLATIQTQIPSDIKHFYLFEINNTVYNRYIGEQIDSTNSTEVDIQNNVSILYKTGNTNNLGYTITLPNILIDGMSLFIYQSFADTTGTSFIPQVVGFSNGTDLGANGVTRIIYRAKTNQWYRLS